MSQYQYERHSWDKSDYCGKQFGHSPILAAEVTAYKAGGMSDWPETEIRLGVGSCSQATVEEMKLHAAYIAEAIAYAESDELQEWLNRPVSAEADKGNSTE
jgi:hypothetical protein